MEVFMKPLLFSLMQMLYLEIGTLKINFKIKTGA